jgi:hypothetical protein
LREHDSTPNGWVVGGSKMEQCLSPVNAQTIKISNFYKVEKTPIAEILTEV